MGRRKANRRNSSRKKSSTFEMKCTGDARSGDKRVWLLPEPLMRLGRSSRKIPVAAHEVVAQARNIGRIVVLVNPELEVFNVSSTATFLVVDAFPGWLIGVYTNEFDEAVVCADLRARRGELVAAGRL